MASETTLHGLLKQMVEMGGSDLHLTTHSPPLVRLDGKLIPLPYPPADGPRDQAARLLGPDRRPEAPVRGEPRARLLLRRQGPGPLPRQQLHAARRRGRRLPADPVRDPGLQGARAAAGRRAALRQAARPDPRLRPDRLGQDDDPGRDARQDQPREAAPHRHDRGPDRVPAPAQEVPRQPARAARRHALVLRTPCARSCAKTPTSCSSARCATSRRSRPRCASPRRAT